MEHVKAFSFAELSYTPALHVLVYIVLVFQMANAIQFGVFAYMIVVCCQIVAIDNRATVEMCLLLYLE